MAEYHFPVPGSVDESKIVIFVHRHWASFIGQFLLSMMMLILPVIILITIYFTQRVILQGLVLNFLTLILSIYYLITATVTFIAWISYYYDVYIVCYDTIIEINQQGFFGRKISQLSLLRVQDVTSDIEGVLPTFFSYGDVVVETAGELSENYIIKSIPNPQEVSSKILELHNQLLEKEGLHHQMLEAEGVLIPGSKKIEMQNQPIPPVQESQPEATIPSENKIIQNDETSTTSGEVSKDDLEKGGEIDLK